MRVRNYLARLFPELAYSFVTIIYLIMLHNLNKKLLAQNFENAFALLAFDGYIAMKYFVVAFIFFVLGCLLLWKNLHHIMQHEVTVEDMLISIIAFFMIALIIVLLIIFINNPILRAVLTVLAIGVCIYAAE